MKNLIWLLIFPILFAACDSEEIDPTKGTVELNMKATYGDDQFIMNDFYEYDNGMQISFATLLFYISDVKLVNEANEEFSLAEVGFVNFYNNHSTAATAGNGEDILSASLKEGTYKSLRFGVGLPAAINSTNPSDYGPDSPLSRTEMYWDWKGTYIFSMVEGNLDTLANGGNPTPDLGLTYHSGADAMYRQVEIPINFVVKAQETQGLQLELDARKIFITDTVFDVKTNFKSHADPADYQIAETIITNLANAISVVD